MKKEDSNNDWKVSVQGFCVDGAGMKNVKKKFMRSPWMC